MNPKIHIHITVIQYVPFLQTKQKKTHSNTTPNSIGLAQWDNVPHHIIKITLERLEDCCKESKALTQRSKSPDPNLIERSKEMPDMPTHRIQRIYCQHH